MNNENSQTSINLELAEINATAKVNEIKKLLEDAGLSLSPAPGQTTTPEQKQYSNALIKQRAAVYANWHDKGGPNMFECMKMLYQLNKNNSSN